MKTARYLILICLISIAGKAIAQHEHHQVQKDTSKTMSQCRILLLKSSNESLWLRHRLPS